ncbi:MAG: NADH-ubiquinone oxidoreductase-F iron-sulfur binding region domain-containing protein [Vulcanimicrobiota bacterium]
MSNNSIDSNKVINILKNKSGVFLKRKITRPTVFYGAGTCGLAAGVEKSVEEIKTVLKEKNIEAGFIKVGCVGYCEVEPIIDVQLPEHNRISFHQVTPEKAKLIARNFILYKSLSNIEALGQYNENGLKVFPEVAEIDKIPFFKRQQKLVLENCGIINPVSIEEYISKQGFTSLYKVLTSMTPSDVVDEITKSGLRGRGGGGFPTGRKWSFALNQNKPKKYIICNADEGDPGAFMDRSVLEGDPCRVIEGMIIAGYAIGADEGYIYTRAEYPLAIEHLQLAIETLEKLNILGENILDSGFNFKLKLKKGAGAFVCGEETALIASIEGKRGMPRYRPPYPAVSGLFDCPTIINNVETLANVPSIIRMGAEEFSKIGTSGSKGTKVFALSGKIRNNGLVEVPMGISLKEIIFDIGGGIPDNKEFKAVQIGGPSGGCIPESLLDTPIDYESLKTVGAMMGSGGLVTMDEDTCMVDVARFFMDFIQKESCGKCIPCREGTLRLYEILERITTPTKTMSEMDRLERFRGIIYMERLADSIKNTALCGLGQTAANPVLSTLTYFKDEYEEHIYNNRCPAGACSGMQEFRVIPEMCKGCGLCKRKCPTSAIVGELKHPHYIVSEKCVGCAACYNICKFKAIERVK